MNLIFFVGLGGAAGSISRYLIYLFIVRYLGIIYPIQTLIVNILGSFLIGILIEFVSAKIIKLTKGIQSNMQHITVPATPAPISFLNCARVTSWKI